MGHDLASNYSCPYNQPSSSLPPSELRIAGGFGSRPVSHSFTHGILPCLRPSVRAVKCRRGRISRDKLFHDGLRGFSSWASNYIFSDNFFWRPSSSVSVSSCFGTSGSRTSIKIRLDLCPGFPESNELLYDFLLITFCYCLN